MISHLAVDGLANVRDLGGLRRSDGSSTPTRVFVRAELLDDLTPAGWEQLVGYGVRTVLDLRRPDEHSGRVPEGVRHVRIDLDGDDQAFWAPIEADGRWGTPLSAFREAYRALDLDGWFARAGIDAATRAALTSWRGTACPLGC